MSDDHSLEVVTLIISAGEFDVTLFLPLRRKPRKLGRLVVFSSRSKYWNHHNTYSLSCKLEIDCRIAGGNVANDFGTSYSRIGTSGCGNWSSRTGK